MSPITLHLRSETKPFEHRSALTPSTVHQLLQKGFKVNVERSPVRIFEDKNFEDVGATLVDEGSWPHAPTDHIIIGLKELPEEKFPLRHTHIQFAHCFKGQGGWQDVLARFPAGGGTLYDMEFLEDDNRRRVAAFGYHAGFAGAALAVLDWAWQLEHGTSSLLPGKKPYNTDADLVKEVKSELQKGISKNQGKPPQVIVIGALGRCGRGAVDLLTSTGVPESHILRWDMEETKTPGPYTAIRESDIFVNCIYLDKDIPKFVTEDFLKQGERRLSVVCDVSCDTSNPRNPIPFADKSTYFDKPTIALSGFDSPPLSIITIDHLPSLLPREASESFSNALLPSLLELQDRTKARVWKQAEQLFKDKVATLPANLQEPMGNLNGHTKPTTA